MSVALEAQASASGVTSPHIACITFKLYFIILTLLNLEFGNTVFQGLVILVFHHSN